MHRFNLPGILAEGFELGAPQFIIKEYDWFSVLDQLAPKKPEFHEKLVSMERILASCFFYGLQIRFLMVLWECKTESSQGSQKSFGKIPSSILFFIIDHRIKNENIASKPILQVYIWNLRPFGENKTWIK